MSNQTSLFTLVDTKLKEKPYVLLAIDGRCGAGKSSLARLLENKYGAMIFHMDDFFLPYAMKTQGRLAQPGGNSDWERFEQEVLKNLINHCDFTYNAYDCHTRTMHPKQSKTRPLSVIEGAYSLHPELSGYYDIKVFMDVTPDIQQMRILERNGEEMMKRFLDEWIPLENLYIDSLEIKSSCDIIL
jgi:uridine kinase